MPQQDFKGSISGYGSILPKGTELVINGLLFTDATGATPPTGWTAAPAGLYTITDDGAGHETCLKIACNATPTANPGIQQIATVVVDHYYQLQWDYKNGDATRVQADIGTSSTGGQYTYLTNAATAWKTIVFIFKATTVSCYLNFRTVAAVSGKYGLFDNITMKELPLAVEGDVFCTGNARVVIPTYTDNAAAIAGGLVAGQFYRVNAAIDPEPLYIVH